MADYKAWQVLRRHLLGLTWPPAPRLAEEELKKLAKHNSDAPSPSSLLDAAEVHRRDICDSLTRTVGRPLERRGR